jgi:hypothetical protein
MDSISDASTIGDNNVAKTVQKLPTLMFYFDANLPVEKRIGGKTETGNGSRLKRKTFSLISYCEKDLKEDLSEVILVVNYQNS